MVLVLFYHRSKITSVWGWSPLFTHMPILNFKRKRLLKKTNFNVILEFLQNLKLSQYMSTHVHLAPTVGKEAGCGGWNSMSVGSQQDLNLNPRWANYRVFILGLWYKPLILSYIICKIKTITWITELLWPLNEVNMCRKDHRKVSHDHFSYNNTLSPLQEQYWI